MPSCLRRTSWCPNFNAAPSFTGCGKTVLPCHSEESANLNGGRRGISHCIKNTQGEIPLRRLTDRNDSLEGFLRSLFSPACADPSFSSGQTLEVGATTASAAKMAPPRSN
jgi:hypothetical protein